MSAKENPCRKFQANIFNKSKCQNCFKPRESHLLNDEDLNQVSGADPDPRAGLRAGGGVGLLPCRRCCVLRVAAVLISCTQFGGGGNRIGARKGLLVSVLQEEVRGAAKIGAWGT